MSSDFPLNRIRILKTGVANVQRRIDMHQAANRLYFEEIAEPGTELTLRRTFRPYDPDPFDIEVLAPDGRLLGYVTRGKNETTARLMDAGLKVIAIVNESMPIHDSDSSEGLAHAVNNRDPGWNAESRAYEGYTSCNLPFCIYLVDE